MNDKVLLIESLSIDTILKLNTSTKRCATQLREISSNAEELLSKKDHNTLLSAIDILNKVVEKRKIVIDKKTKKIKKLKKLKNTLKSKIDKFDDKKKLAYILTVNIDSFKYFGQSFEIIYDEFLEICAKRLEKMNITPEELIQTIEDNIVNNKSKQFLEEMNKRILVK